MVRHTHDLVSYAREIARLCEEFQELSTSPVSTEYELIECANEIESVAQAIKARIGVGATNPNQPSLFEVIE